MGSLSPRAMHIDMKRGFSLSLLLYAPRWVIRRDEGKIYFTAAAAAPPLYPELEIVVAEDII